MDFACILHSRFFVHNIYEGGLTIQVTIYPGEQRGYVAEAIHLPVVTQGETIDKTFINIREALSLHLEGENLRDLRFS